MSNIDIVITWVDDSDSKWLDKRRQYSDYNHTLNGNARFRDSEILKYTLRSIELYCPWIRTVFLVVDNQIPRWLNCNYSKLRIVNHQDFIPNEYLPTFNSNAIELNIFKIKDLSNHFILMNDDMLFTQQLNPNDFFKNGIPRDNAILAPRFPKVTGIDNILINNLKYINLHFNKRESVKQNISKYYNMKNGLLGIKTALLFPYQSFCGFIDFHTPIAYDKRIFQEVLETKVRSSYIDTSSHKFRTDSDINHWLIRYWQLASGHFIPRNISIHSYREMWDVEGISHDLMDSKIKLMCINDVQEVVDYENNKREILEMLDNKFPHKSSFELRE